MRALLIILAIFHAANGATMLALPELWYLTVPGVAETGPVNAHFVRDIGLAFLAASAALAASVRSAEPARLLGVALVFTGGHALLHAAELAAHQPGAAAALRDTMTVIVPGLLPALLIAKLRRGRPA